MVRRSDSAGLEVVGQTDVDALVGEDGHLVDLGVVVLRLIELGGVEPGIDQVLPYALFAQLLIQSVGMKNKLGIGPIFEIPAQ